MLSETNKLTHWNINAMIDYSNYCFFIMMLMFANIFVFILGLKIAHFFFMFWHFSVTNEPFVLKIVGRNFSQKVDFLSLYLKN